MMCIFILYHNTDSYSVIRDSFILYYDTTSYSVMMYNFILYYYSVSYSVMMYNFILYYYTASWSCSAASLWNGCCAAYLTVVCGVDVYKVIALITAWDSGVWTKLSCVSILFENHSNSQNEWKWFVIGPLENLSVTYSHSECVAVHWKTQTMRWWSD